MTHYVSVLAKLTIHMHCILLVLRFRVMVSTESTAT